MKKLLIYIFTAALALSVLIIFVLYSLKDDKLHIIFCDVGQGDAILIVTPNQGQILIDGGPSKAVLSCFDRHMPFWDRSLEAIILTHPHADHYFGLIDVIDRYKLNGFYIEDVKTESEAYNLLEAKLASQKLSAKDLNDGDDFKDRSGLKIKILWPRLGEIDKTDQNIANLDLNGLSVVALITFGNFSALMTGDAGERVMSMISNEAGDVDLLKVPHHGSRTGMNDDFLKTIKSELSIISVGKENRYGHPSKNILELLSINNSKILRTDLNGEVEVITDGNTYEIKSLR